MRRRDWIRLVAGAGLPLVAPIPARAARRPPVPSRSDGFGRAQSVILVLASGGQSQLETWDPRPEAPADIRGAFGVIQTPVPGTVLGEHLPRLAALANRYAIVRTMSHEDLDHGSALYLTLTGHYHPRRSSNPPPRETDLPFIGSILEQLHPTSQFLRSSVIVNGPALVPWEPGPGQYPGLLGRRFDPLILGDVSREEPGIPGLEDLEGLSPERRGRRRRLLSHLEALGTDVRHPRVEMSTLYAQAFEMLERPAVRGIVDLETEPAPVRDRYGRHRPGQACLMARRLVEAGVPLVTVVWNHSNRGQDRDPDDFDQHGWDTHNDIFDVLRQSLLPRFDQSFSALLEDLDNRGLLDSTLVVCLGEFGRAPLVALERNFAGQSPGRKHWAAAYSVVLAGAGVQGGHIVGATDRHAAYPVTTPFGPWDLAATVFHALGIDSTGHYYDNAQRPYPICSGQPIRQLYGASS